MKKISMDSRKWLLTFFPKQWHIFRKKMNFIIYILKLSWQNSASYSSKKIVSKIMIQNMHHVLRVDLWKKQFKNK